MCICKKRWGAIVERTKSRVVEGEKGEGEVVSAAEERKNKATLGVSSA